MAGVGASVVVGEAADAGEVACCLGADGVDGSCGDDGGT